MITEEQIKEAFEGTSYGDNPNYNAIIVDTLLKLTVGFSTGKTSKQVCGELGLLNSKLKPTSKGFAFMRENYDLINKSKN
jgi:hypothetical protein